MCVCACLTGINYNQFFVPFFLHLEVLKNMFTVPSSMLICNDGFGVGILKHQNVETPVVCNVLDVNGEVAAGVASVEALVSKISIK